MIRARYARKKIGGTSKTSRAKPKRPDAMRGTSIANRFDRTSRLLTLVDVEKRARQTAGRLTSNDEKCIARISGAAAAERVAGVGHARGIDPTLAFSGIGVGEDAHPATRSRQNVTHTLTVMRSPR
jgi:hypothetical protein